VLVKDGDVVQAGQVLVELDATNASADGASVLEQLSVTTSEVMRTTALLQAVRLAKTPALLPLPRGEGWGRDGAFEAHAPSPSSGSGMQAAARTAGEGGLSAPIQI
jgi:multidrug efflux pump subunit AcrA (membrane-fusion protein)